MKKFLKLFLCLLLMVGVTACGGKDSSDDKEKAVVTEFFEAFKAGDLNKVADLCSKDSKDLGEFQSIIDEMDSFADAETYGETFAKEAQSFASEVYKTLFVTYEVTNSKKDGDKYVVTAKATLKDFSDIDFNSAELTKLTEDYQKENLAELQKIYQEQGQDKMMAKIYDDLSGKMFDIMKKQLKDVEEVKEEIQFTVVEEDGQLKISKIAEFKA